MQTNQKHGSKNHPSYHLTPQLSWGIKQKRSNSSCGKMKVTEKVLPELTSDLFEVIAKRLDVVDFCAFGAVCKNWMGICDRSKEDFLESVAPMAMLTSSSINTQQSYLYGMGMLKSSSNNMQKCYLYDMANGMKKSFSLHNFIDKFFVGSSAGYIITETINRQVFLVNPLTGHQLTYHTPPYWLRGRSLHDHIILASNLSSKSHVFIAISNNKLEFQVFNSENGQWFTGLFSRPWVDIAIFKDQVYVLTKEAQLGEMRIKVIGSTFTWLGVKNTPKVDSQDLKLVVSDNQLLMVDFFPKKHLNIYEMDFDAMEWIKVDKLGDQALFLGGRWDSAIRKPDRWGGQSNCVYHLETPFARYSTYSMEAKLIDNFPLVENPHTFELCSLGWYYPHQCMKVNYLAMDPEI